MKKNIFLLSSVVFFSFSTFHAVPQRACTGFLPPNTMSIPDSKNAKGISAQQFDEVLDLIQRIYKPIFNSQWYVLDIQRFWDDPTVNASASRLGPACIVKLYGGLARHEAITQDGFALVACHEISHHLGGAPKSKKIRWATNEGQADYAASLKCLRRVFSDASSASFTRTEQADPVAKKACASAYQGPGQELCVRTAMAGMSVSGLLRALHQESVWPYFDTPDPGVVEQTQDSHPGTQCRLDTLFQGSLCPKPVAESLSNENPIPGSCTRSQGFSVGLRPLCWYRPGPLELAPVAKRSILTELKARDSGMISSLSDPGLWRGL